MMRGTGWCWHRWTRWSDPVDQKIRVYGEEGFASFQKRTCMKCNKGQEREVRSY